MPITKEELLNAIQKRKKIIEEKGVNVEVHILEKTRKGIKEVGSGSNDGKDVVLGALTDIETEIEKEWGNEEITEINGDLLDTFVEAAIKAVVEEFYKQQAFDLIKKDGKRND